LPVYLGVSSCLCHISTNYKKKKKKKTKKKESHTHTMDAMFADIEKDHGDADAPEESGSNAAPEPDREDDDGKAAKLPEDGEPSKSEGEDADDDDRGYMSADETKEKPSGASDDDRSETVYKSPLSVEAAGEKMARVMQMIDETDDHPRKQPMTKPQRGLGKGKSCGKGMGTGFSAARHRSRAVKRKGITKPSTRRLARRAGVGRISGDLYESVKAEYFSFLDTVLADACTYCAHARCKTVTAQHVLEALRRHGMVLYGYDK
jgi:histone H4